MAAYLYKVREGDTILSVCLAFDLDYEKFARLNSDFNSMGHRYAGHLVPGELIVVGNSSSIIDRLRIEQKKYGAK